MPLPNQPFEHVQLDLKGHFDNLHGTELHQTDMDLIVPCDIIVRTGPGDAIVILYVMEYGILDSCVFLASFQGSHSRKGEDTLVTEEGQTVDFLCIIISCDTRSLLLL